MKAGMIYVGLPLHVKTLRLINWPRGDQEEERVGLTWFSGEEAGDNRRISNGLNQQAALYPLCFERCVQVEHSLGLYGAQHCEELMTEALMESKFLFPMLEFASLFRPHFAKIRYARVTDTGILTEASQLVSKAMCMPENKKLLSSHLPL